MFSLILVHGKASCQQVSFRFSSFWFTLFIFNWKCCKSFSNNDYLMHSHVVLTSGMLSLNLIQQDLLPLEVKRSRIRFEWKNQIKLN